MATSASRRHSGGRSAFGSTRVFRYSRCSDAMTKIAPAMLAPICSSMIGCASLSAMMPHTTTSASTL